MFITDLIWSNENGVKEKLYLFEKQIFYIESSMRLFPTAEL